jgi:hypothetical membrane protein
MDTTRPADAAPASSALRLRMAGMVLIALGALFLFVIMLAASIAPGYDMNAGAISDLGTFDETAILFNATLVAVGLLNAIAGLMLRPWLGKSWILALFLIAGLGAIGAGLFPLDSGGPHGLFALVAFLAFNLEPLAIATIVRGPMRAISSLAGVVGLVFVALMVVGDSGTPAAFGAIGHGGTERMIVYPVMAWMLAIGGYLDAPAVISTEIVYISASRRSVRSFAATHRCRRVGAEEGP